MPRSALTLLCAGLALCSSPALAQSGAELRRRTAYIVERYLTIWSSNDGGAVAGVPYMYGPTVQFYGRPYTQGQLIAEKRAAIRQWPLRRYAIRPGTLHVICNIPQAKCAARAVTDFEVANPARGTRKAGSARFDLGVSYAGRQPRILYEGGSLGRHREG
jgi:hypothetical protein